MANVITYGVTLDASGAVNGFKRLGAEMDKSGKDMAGLESRAKKLGVALGISVAAGIGIAVAGFRKMIRESSEAQFVQAQLASAIKSTGGVAGQSVAGLNAHATALMRVSTFSDEAIGTGQALMLTFRRISGDVFPRATQAALDMATAMRTDLTSAVMQIAKALDSPTEGLTNLQRAGVRFSEAQKEVIESLVKTNRLAEAQTIILKELETQFGGSAAAARNTLGGALTGLANEFNNLFEVSEEGTRGLTRAVNALANALPGVVAGFKAAIAVTVPGFGFGGPQPKGVAELTAAQQLVKDYDALIARLANTTVPALVSAEEVARRERRAAYEEAKVFAAEKKGWDDAEVIRLGRIAAAAQAALGARLGITPGQQGNVSLGARRTPLGGGITIGAGGVPGTAAQRARDNAKLMADAEQQMETFAKQSEMVTENFLRGMQSGFATFFTSLATDGLSSFKGLVDSMKGLLINMFAELAAKKLMDSLFKSAGAGIGGLLGSLGPIAAGAVILGGIFGGRRSLDSRTTSNRNVRRSTYEQDLANNARREAEGGFGALNDNAVRQSVGGVLTESSANRIVGNLESIRIGIFQLVGLARGGGLGGNQVTVNTTASDPAGTGAQVAATLDRLLGGKVQNLRLAAGAATVG